MQLRTKLEVLEHADHWSHKVTLALVALSLLALIMGNLHPYAHTAETALTKLLHFVHWFALAIVCIYLFARFLLERNVGREVAQLLEANDRIGQKPNTDVPAADPSVSKSLPATKSLALAIAQEELEFVSSSRSDLAKLLYTMNLEGFERSAFELSENEVMSRNSMIIDRNPKTFLFVRNKASGHAPSTSKQFIGYTCVLPLNEAGADIYLHGLIKDRDMRAILLCREGEAASALLVFAIVLNRGLVANRSLKGKYFGFLLKALEYHVSTLAAAHTRDGKAMDVWAQSEHGSLRKRLMERGFVSTTPPTVSADGFELLRLSFALPQPAPTSSSAAGRVQATLDGLSPPLTDPTGTGTKKSDAGPGANSEAKK